MKYLSICSGIEAATVAWHPLGWTPLAFAEIDRFPSAVLAHHYPEVPNLGDFTQIQASDLRSAPDILVGGPPCQDFSVAGLRAGLCGARGQLTIEFARLAERLRPRWLVWENVPGVLSADRGRAFGTFLGALGQIGYGFAYRVLDAQWFGVPQRRRRVFVVGHLGDWRAAAAVLFERHSLSGDTPPRRETGQGAPTIPARRTGGGGLGTDFDCDGRLIVFGGNNTAGPIDIATAVNAHGGPSGRIDFESETFVVHTTDAGFWQSGFGTLRGRQQDSHENLVAHSLRADGFDASEDGIGRGTPLVSVAFTAKDYGVDAGEIAHTLRAGGFTKSHANAGVMPAVAFNSREDCVSSSECFGALGSSSPQAQAIAFNLRGREGGSQPEMDDLASVRAASGGSSRSYIAQGKCGSQAELAHGNFAVRRLLVEECELLQGFPRGYTLLPGKTADGPRYKALGNSMAVPVMRWIGQRIRLVEFIVDAKLNQQGDS